MSGKVQSKEIERGRLEVYWMKQNTGNRRQEPEGWMKREPAKTFEDLIVWRKVSMLGCSVPYVMGNVRNFFSDHQTEKTPDKRRILCGNKLADVNLHT